MVLYQEVVNVRTLETEPKPRRQKSFATYTKSNNIFEVLARLSSILEPTDLTHNVTVCFLFCFCTCLSDKTCTLTRFIWAEAGTQ